MSVRKRLERLEQRDPGEARRPRSPEHVYERIRKEARESIEESLQEGDEPLYRIADNGDVETAHGRPVDHYGDFHRALDERIDKLNREIAELEAQETEEETDERRG
jgi:hypothetical protein